MVIIIITIVIVITIITIIMVIIIITIVIVITIITITIVIIIIPTTTKPERSSSPPSSHPRWRACRSKPRFQSSRCLQEFTIKIKIGRERWQ